MLVLVENGQLLTGAPFSSDLAGQWEREVLLVGGLLSREPGYHFNVGEVA